MATEMTASMPATDKLDPLGQSLAFSGVLRGAGKIPARFARARVMKENVDDVGVARTASASLRGKNGLGPHQVFV
ncbi:hypothetical protein AAFG13_35935 [Bradyrhizobium sp. B124]|uniref:hypothetical protein n=1 Tax=Bradyrhizobium sp. B124 TaxID=3140245 RepID=UPI003183C124